MGIKGYFFIFKLAKWWYNWKNLLSHTQLIINTIIVDKFSKNRISNILIDY